MEPMHIGFKELYDSIESLRTEVRTDRMDTAVRLAKAELRLERLESARGWLRNLPLQIPAWLIASAAIIVSIAK